MVGPVYYVAMLNREEDNREIKTMQIENENSITTASKLISMSKLKILNVVQIYVMINLFLV